MKWIALLAIALSGCANYGGMSADQIKASVADKNAGAVCARIVGVWGTAVTVVANLDQRVIDSGGMTVSSANGDCAVSINNVKAAPVPRPVPVVVPVDPSKVPQ